MKKQALFTITFGLGYDRAGKALSEGRRTLALRYAKQELTHAFGGCTLRGCRGSYLHKSGMLAEESVCEVSVAAPASAATRKILRSVCEYAKVVLKQECVLLTEVPARVKFV